VDFDTGHSARSACNFWQQFVITQNKEQAEALWHARQMWTLSQSALVEQQQQSVSWSPDFRALHFPWVLPLNGPPSRWHVNATITEELDFCLTAPDVATYACPTTEHVPVLHFHTTQIERAMDAMGGRMPPVAEGPPLYVQENVAGLRYYHGFGEACNVGAHATDWTLPATMSELFVDPYDWEYIECWLCFYMDAVAQVNKGMQFKANRLPGGREGIDIPIDALKSKYRRCVWRNCDGVPEPVEVTLPDQWTQVRVFDVYRDCYAYGVPDIGIASMMGLYGFQSKTRCSDTSTLIPNYKGLWPHVSVLQKIREAKQNDFGLFPRLTLTTPYLQYFPCRFFDFSVHFSPMSTWCKHRRNHTIN
jgi:hypothetical protein